MYLILSLLGKLIIFASRLLNLGAGSTWPGHIAMEAHPSFLKDFAKRFKGLPAGRQGKIVIIAGTNGKTTTSKMIRSILEADGKQVIHNESGANLLNGVASAVIQSASLNGKQNAKVAIFETDESNLPLLLKEIAPDLVVVLNIFRDQLDRYGEVEMVASKWKKAIDALPAQTSLILNANDPYVSFLGKEKKENVQYFGLSDKKLFLGKRPHAIDATYCPNCNVKLAFDGFYLSHLGNWKCSSCGFSMPRIAVGKVSLSLPGIYNIYNAQAAFLVAKALGVDETIINKALNTFIPAFGRQERFSVDGLPADRRGKNIQIFLSKNPAGFTESIRTVRQLGGKYFMIVLNDRIPDGRDVSWIWDVDFEELSNASRIIISGDRAYDMGLRVKYSTPELPITNYQLPVQEDLKKAISLALENVSKTETLYILPTYSAMLEVRKILTGRKLL